MWILYPEFLELVVEFNLFPPLGVPLSYWFCVTIIMRTGSNCIYFFLQWPSSSFGDESAVYCICVHAAHLGKVHPLLSLHDLWTPPSSLTLNLKSLDLDQTLTINLFSFYKNLHFKGFYPQKSLTSHYKHLEI